MSWLASGFRADAAARLVALNTLAGISVEACRASAVPDELLPFLGVYTDLQEAPLQSTGGTEPRFDAKLHLTVEPKIQATTVAAAAALLDQLIGQVLDGLLSDPDWIRQFNRVASFTVHSQVNNEGSAFTGLARIVFVLEYTEDYPPRLGGPLTAIDLTEQVGTQQIGATIVIPTE